MYLSILSLSSSFTSNKIGWGSSSSSKSVNNSGTWGSSTSDNSNSNSNSSGNGSGSGWGSSSSSSTNAGGWGTSSGSNSGGWGNSSSSNSNSNSGSGWGTPANGNNNGNNNQQQNQQRPAMDNPERKIKRIMAAYECHNPESRFQFMFYNKISATEAQRYQKPPHVNQKLWQQAVRNNPDPKSLVPSLAVGFDDIKNRIVQQDRANQVYQKQLQEIQKVIVHMRQRYKSVTKVKVAEFRQHHTKLAHRLLKLVHKIQMLQTHGYPILNEEITFRKKLENIHRELKKPTQFQARVAELASVVRMQEERPNEVMTKIDQDNVYNVQRFLNLQHQGLQYLTDVLKKDLRDLRTIMQGMTIANKPAL
jgi:nuclear pore complex protein Nup54